MSAATVQQCLGYPAPLQRADANAKSAALAYTYTAKFAPGSFSDEIELHVYPRERHFEHGLVGARIDSEAITVGTRTATRYALSAGMGGSFLWTELPSPRGSYNLVLLIGYGHSDIARSDDLAATAAHARVGELLEAGSFAAALGCLDAAIW